ncbi:MAG: tetratricopeptide repeat protein [Planctomycetota bacterium]|jgi:tetratricopeptide (TPR) repeat protein
MSVKMNRIGLLVAVASILTIASTAAADGWFSKMGHAKEVTLGELLRNPRAYVGVTVKVELYYEQPGGSYNPYYTRFSEEMYANFAAWPIDARLYEKRDYQRPYKFFFMKRSNQRWKRLQKLEPVTPVEVVGTVREVFRGQPWIEVERFRKVRRGLSQKDVRYVIAGDAYFLAGRYDDATRRYKKALSSRLPGSVRADLYRRLADAYYHGGHYTTALRNYGYGLRTAPNSTVLRQGLRATRDAIARHKARRRGKPVPETVREPAPRTRSVNPSGNDVDEIIELLEDPAVVEAEVESWYLELEKRAARARGLTGVTPVSHKEETPEAEVEAEAVAEEATEERDEVVEDVDAPDAVEEDAEEATEATDVENDEEAPMERDLEETTEEAEGYGEETAEETDRSDVEEVVEDLGDETAEGAPAGDGVDETAQLGNEVVSGDARVVKVAGHVVRLPRLPFVGCEDVTLADQRVILEEVIRNPEQ